MRELTVEHEVFLFTVQPEEDFNKDSEPIFPKNVRIISLSNAKTYRSFLNIFPNRLADFLNYRILKKTLFTNTNGYFLKAYPLLLQKLQEINPSVVIYENLESVSLFSSLVRKYLPGAKQIYDALNVDSELWNQLAIAQNNQVLSSYARTALKTEKTLHKKVDAIFCCSNADEKKLQSLNNKRLKSFVVPNGVDTAEKEFDQNTEKNMRDEILFCGSLEYYPNEEGLRWFYKEVFPLIKMEMPDIKLTLVGTEIKNDKWKMLIDDPSVNFEGRVENVKQFYYRASVCIAPLLSGSGTRLKILEAMSFGNPVISTMIGAEGINAMTEKHLFIRDKPEEFAAAIIKLLGSKSLFNSIRTDACTLVKAEYDWKKIGFRVKEFFDKELYDKIA